MRACRKEDGEKHAAAARSDERVCKKQDKESAAKRERRVVVEKADRSCREGWRRASSNCVGNEERQRRRQQQRRHPLRVHTFAHACVRVLVFSFSSLSALPCIEHLPRGLAMFLRTLPFISFRLRDAARPQNLSSSAFSYWPSTPRPFARSFPFPSEASLFSLCPTPSHYIYRARETGGYSARVQCCRVWHTAPLRAQGRTRLVRSPSRFTDSSRVSQFATLALARLIELLHQERTKRPRPFRASEHVEPVH